LQGGPAGPSTPLRAGSRPPALPFPRSDGLSTIELHPIRGQTGRFFLSRITACQS